MKTKKILISITVLLSAICIVLGGLCIKFNADIDKYKENADYTYDLYLQGISDAEKEMYQEWIDNLGTDELSAYKQGYSEGLSDGKNNYDSELYDNGYTEGYDNAKDEYYNKVIYTLLVLIILNFIIMISISQKITKELKS